MSESLRYSVVIPVFNSESLVERTIEACCAFLEGLKSTYEIVLVDDGSTDGSWNVLRRAVVGRPHIVAVKLLKNYGQHTAVLCGLAHSRGGRVVTLDDDLQNPPEEIEHLIKAADDGHDVVFGRFKHKRHSLTRRLGSSLVNLINTRIFRKPRGLALTNFRLLERPVVERILAHKTHYPYVNGLAVLYAENPTNVAVEHRPRAEGESNYSFVRILELVMRILFNYSSFPLRLVSLVGIMIAAASFILAAYFLAHALAVGTAVPGWASVAVMLSFFNGVSLLLLGMLGEYVTRILDQVSHAEAYTVVRIVRHEE